MKNNKPVSVLLTGCLLGLGASSASFASPNQFESHALRTTHAALKQASNASIPFIHNSGQVNKDVSYYARLFSGTLFITKNNALVYSLQTPVSESPDTTQAQPRWSFRESFVNSQQAYPRGYTPSQVNISQFKGNSPTTWRKQLSTFNNVDLGELYRGIRITLRATGNNVEKLFYVSPGANVADIKISLEGVQQSTIGDKGELHLNYGPAKVSFTPPIAWQDIEGIRHAVDVAYTLSANTYGFKLGEYDPTHEVIIDPLLASTFLGGVNANLPQYSNYDQDVAYSIVDAGDSVYVGGVTQSTDFPMVLGYDDTANDSGRPDGFIARFSNDLSTLYSSTFFGTENFDRVSAIAMDTDGSIVATGQAGYGFPVTASAYNYQGSEPVGGGFVAKFSADLSSLVASAVVTPSDYPTALTIGNGSIYFAGRTNVPTFPITENAFLSTCCRVINSFGQRDHDGFIGKISTDLSTLQAMSYLGGDGVTSIAVAPDSSLYLTDSFSSGITGTLSHMDADLTTRFARVSLYPGTTSGSSRHYFYDVTVGISFVIAVGQTYLNDLPVTTGAFDTTCGSDGDCNNSSSTLYLPKPDGFVSKYSLDLQTVLATTYFGGSDADSLNNVAIDSAGNIVIAGTTQSSDMPTSSNAENSSCANSSNCSDVFVARLNADLTQLQYGSYLGGSESESVYDIAVAQDDTVFVAGSTRSPDFPTTSSAYDKTYAGGASGQNDADAFISQFDMSGDGSGGGSGGSGGGGTGGGGSSNVAPLADAGSDQTVGPQQTVYLNGSNSSDGDGTIEEYRWTQVAGRKVTLINANSAVANFVSPRVRRNKIRRLEFELQVTDDQGATSTDQVSIFVTR